MDASDTEISFDHAGRCNHCREYVDSRESVRWQQQSEEALGRAIEYMIRRGSADYDCVVGVSGGFDSSVAACLALEVGLRPLAVHVDNGWNSEIAVSNIENLVKGLGIDLFTVVLDWEIFSDYQRAFLLASVPDVEIPTDHAIRAGLWSAAQTFGLQSFVNGRNYETEGIHALSWSYSALDWKYISGIHRLFGTRKGQIPHSSLFDIFTATSVRRYRNYSLLNMVPFDVPEWTERLESQFGWKSYAGKHYESTYTRFTQSSLLPRKFGIDKRKAHLSVQICNGSLTREQALTQLAQPPISNELEHRDLTYVLTKLDLAPDEFEQILSAPKRTWMDYPNNSRFLRLRDRSLWKSGAQLARAVGLLPKGFGDRALSSNLSKRGQ